MADTTTTARIKLALEGASAVQSGLAKVESSATSLGRSMAGLLAGSLSTAAFVSMVRETAQLGQELGRLSVLTNTNAQQFQAWAYGAQRVGVQNEKLADILKDVQDKVGDFLQTGGGAMADFFENIAPKVGVTAEQFRRLGGADALQLYVSSLERANLSQSEMVFYLEAIASDSSVLYPLLRNNGQEMAQMAREAENLGLLMSDHAIAESKEFSRSLQSLESNVASVTRWVAGPLIEAINNAASAFVLARKHSTDFFDALFLPGQADAANKLKDYQERLDDLNESRERYLRAGSDTRGIDQAIATAQRTVNYLTEAAKIQRLAGVRYGDDDQSAAEAARLGRFAQPKSPNPPAKPKPAKGGKSAEQTAAEEYDKWMARFAEANGRRQMDVAEKVLRHQVDEQTAYEDWLRGMDESASAYRFKLFEDRLDAQLSDESQAIVDLYNDQVRAGLQANEQIAQSLTDSLMAGGKNFLDYLEDYARTIVLRPMLDPIGQAMSGMLGSASNMLGLSGMAAGFGQSVAAGSSALFAGEAAGALAGSGALIGTGTAAGIATGIGTAIGVALPVVGIIAGVSSMLEKKVKAQGIGAQFDGAGGIDAYSFTRRGNVFGNSTSTSALNDGGAFEAQLRNVQGSAAGYAAALGLTADAINSYTGDFKINLKGLNDTEATAKVREETNKLKAEMLTTAQVSNDLAAGILRTKGQMQELNAANLSMIESTQAAMENAGITSGAIADVLVQGMTGRITEAQAGEQMADIVLGGIYNSIASGPATAIADAFNSLIIEPLMMAALQGAPIAGVVAQTSIDAVMATATRAMNTMNQVLNDPAFRASMDALYSTIKGLAGVTTSSAGSIKKYRSAVSSSGSAAAAAAAQVKSAFESIVDSITKEMDRLRGNILGNTSSAAQAYYMSQFATLTAQARAGDKTAAEKLGDVSQALEEIAKATATSRAELNVTRGTLIESLAQTRAILAARYGIAVPAFDVGTNFVPQDMLAYVHKGEAIVPAAYNPAAAGASQAEVVAELRAVRAELAGVRAAVAASAVVLDDAATGRRPLKQKAVA